MPFFFFFFNRVSERQELCVVTSDLRKRLPPQIPREKGITTPLIMNAPFLWRHKKKHIRQHFFFFVIECSESNANLFYPMFFNALGIYRSVMFFFFLRAEEVVQFLRCNKLCTVSRKKKNKKNISL